MGLDKSPMRLVAPGGPCRHSSIDECYGYFPLTALPDHIGPEFCVYDDEHSGAVVSNKP